MQSNEILLLLTQGQRRARREAWIDNIGKVVFELVLPGQGMIFLSVMLSTDFHCHVLTYYENLKVERVLINPTSGRMILSC